MLIKQNFSQNVVKNLLLNFNIGTVKNIKPLATSGNIAYVITTSQKKYLLRLCPFGFRWRSVKEIDAELEILNHLFSKGFPVQKIIHTKNGSQIISWENHFGYLREYIDAKPKLKPNLIEIKQFGALLGELHNLIAHYRTKYARMHRWDLDETKKHFSGDKKIILRSNFAQKKVFIKNIETILNTLYFSKNLPSGTIHEDLGKRHVLWHKNTIVGIIDFDRCYYGKLVLDLGQACRGWCFIDNWRSWSNEYFYSFIQGYQSKRVLTQLEKKYLGDAIIFGILERSISFCLRYILVTHDPKDKEYALYSVSHDGLIGMIEKNREKINEILGTL